MKTIQNKKGIALVTSLMFTVLSLVITMSLLYMVTSNIRTSGAMKQYRTTTEAAYGGSEIMVKDLVTASFAFSNVSSTFGSSGYSGYMRSLLPSTASPSISSCLRTKLTTVKSLWPSACTTDVTVNAKSKYDVSFNLNAASGQPYTVYSKIVDTMDRKFVVLRNNSSVTLTMAGNTDISASILEGASTTDGAGVSVPHYPYMYRIEIQAERQKNPSEKAKISVQYAY